MNIDVACLMGFLGPWPRRGEELEAGSAPSWTLLLDILRALYLFLHPGLQGSPIRTPAAAPLHCYTWSRTALGLAKDWVSIFFSLESGPDLCIGLIVVLIQHHRHATRRFISVHWSCRFLDLKAQHQLPLLPFRTELPHCISTLSDPLTISYHHNSTHLLSFQDAQPNGHSSTPCYHSSAPFAQHPTTSR